MSGSITIVIPTKDRPHGLRVAVTSALDACVEAATGDVVVVDDRSANPAAHVLADISALNLKILLNQRNAGPAGARNFGVDKSTSSTIVFLDDDDAMARDYLTRILDGRRAVGNENRVFGYCAVSDNEESRAGKPDINASSGEADLSARLFPLSAGVWTDREAFLKIGGLDEDLRINEDTDFCLAMAFAGHIPIYDPIPGVFINAGRGDAGSGDAGSITKQSRAREREIAFRRILTKHEALLNDHPTTRNRFASRIAKYIARDGRFREAMRFALSQPSGRIKAVTAAMGGALTRKR